MSGFQHSLVLVDRKPMENVVEHVLDLAANEAEDHDHNDPNQEHDQGILDQALPLLTLLQLTYQHLQHFTTPLSNYWNEQILPFIFSSIESYITTRWYKNGLKYH